MQCLSFPSFPSPGPQYRLDIICAFNYIQVMDIFVAVAEPTRRTILEVLAEGERPAGRARGNVPCAHAAGGLATLAGVA